MKDQVGLKPILFRLRWPKCLVCCGPALLGDEGRIVDERNGYRLYECFIDGTLSKARGGGDDVSLTRREMA